MKTRSLKFWVTKIAILATLWVLGGLAVLATDATVKDLSLTSITPTYESVPVAGLYFSNNGEVILHVKNTTSTTLYVTVTTPFELGGLALADINFTMAATTGETMVGPFPPTWFNYSSGTNRGKTVISHSSAYTTYVTAGAFGW